VDYATPEKRAVVQWLRATQNPAYALLARVPEMSPNCHQQPMIATSSNLRT